MLQADSHGQRNPLLFCICLFCFMYMDCSFFRLQMQFLKAGAVRKNKSVLAKGIGVFLPSRIKHKQLTAWQRSLHCPPSSFASHCSNGERPGWLLIVYADASFFHLAPWFILQINSSSLKPRGIRTPKSFPVASIWASRVTFENIPHFLQIRLLIRN